MTRICLSFLAAALALSGPVWASDVAELRIALERERTGIEKFLLDSLRERQALERQLSDGSGLQAQAVLRASLDRVALLHSVSAIVAGCGSVLSAFEARTEVGEPPVVGQSFGLTIRIERISQAACISARLADLERSVTLDALEAEAAASPGSANLEITAWIFRPIQVQAAPPPPVDPPLPADAPADLRRLYTEIRALRRQAAIARTTLDKRRLLFAEAEALRNLDQRAQTQRSLLGSMRAFVEVDPDPGQMILRPDRLVLTGQVDDARQIELVRAATPRSGIAVDTSGLSVRPLPPPIEPGSLPDLSLPGAPQDGGIAVYAVDADAATLVAALGLRDQMLLWVHDAELRMTGRIIAAKPDQAAQAVIRAFPGLAGAFMPPLQGGRGRRVNLSLVRVHAKDALMLIGGLGRSNVIATGELPVVSLLAKEVASDRILEALAKKFGRTFARLGANYYLLAEGQHLPSVRVADRPKFNLALRGVWAAEAIRLLRTVAPGIEQTALCGEGAPLDLRLQGVSPTEALTAVLLSSGAAPTRRECVPAVCMLPGPAAIPPPPGKLVGLLSVENRGAALVRLPGGDSALVREGQTFAGGVARVQSSELVIAKAHGQPERLLLEVPAGDEFRSFRLSATLTGLSRPVAVLENPRTGDTRVVLDGDVFGGSNCHAKVSPGRLEVSCDAPDGKPQPTSVLALRARDRT